MAGISPTIPLAHAAATDAVAGTALRPRRGPWDAAAWDAACDAFARCVGTGDPAVLANLYADARRALRHNTTRR